MEENNLEIKTNKYGLYYVSSKQGATPLCFRNSVYTSTRMAESAISLYLVEKNKAKRTYNKSSPAFKKKLKDAEISNS